METTHTPEPWVLNRAETPIDMSEIWDGEEIICEIYNQERAARIVACVNACAGLKNEELSELPAIIDEGTTAIEENKKLKAEREELINLLKQAHETLTRKSFNNSQLVEAMLSKYLQSLKETKGGN